MQTALDYESMLSVCKPILVIAVSLHELKIHISRLASHETQISCSKAESSRLDHFRMISFVSKVSKGLLDQF